MKYDGISKEQMSILNAESLKIGLENLIQVSGTFRIKKTSFYYVEFSGLYGDNAVKLEPDTDYIFSVDYKKISGDDGDYISLGHGSTGDFLSEMNTQTAEFYMTKTEGRAVIKFKTRPILHAGEYLAIRLNRSSVRNSSEFEYSNFCLRKGSIDLGYTPSLTALEKRIKALEGN